MPVSTLDVVVEIEAELKADGGCEVRGEIEKLVRTIGAVSENVVGAVGTVGSVVEIGIALVSEEGGNDGERSIELERPLGLVVESESTVTLGTTMASVDEITTTLLFD